MTLRLAIVAGLWQPTRATGGNGAGRVTFDVALGLAQRGTSVTVFALTGSDTSPWFQTVTCDGSEIERAAAFSGLRERFDAFIDLSHRHDLSRLYPDWPILNYIMDTACDYAPPRAVVVNEWQQASFPSARIVPLGIDIDAIPFTAEGGTHLVFCHKLHRNKGYDLALEIAERSGKTLLAAGQLLDFHPTANYVGEIESDDLLYRFLGSAQGLLSPCRIDAGGRVNLESAACGTPVIASDWTGTQCHVEDGVSGFVCSTVDEMVEAVGRLPTLPRAKAREWAADTHPLKRMIDGIEALTLATVNKEVW